MFRSEDYALVERLLKSRDLHALLAESEEMTLVGHGSRTTYSRNVFIPLTHLCRDVCRYCTFAKRPSEVESLYLSPEEVLEIARSGERAGCSEALFTLGDRPEARYGAARDWLKRHGYESTLDYVGAMARLVLAETSLLPHLNPGLMSADDFKKLRPYSASMGLMLESSSERLCARSGPHFGSPDKDPSRRLASIDAAGEEKIPFTTGILIGIGETRRERLDALLKLRDLHRKHGHVQEIIVQNFRAKGGTKMSAYPEPALDDHLWTIAAARMTFGPDMTIQAPPNLRPEELPLLLRAGVNDWGGVSPVTMDFVNPEAKWPEISALEEATALARRHLAERLPVAAPYVREIDKWADTALAIRVRREADAAGLRRTNEWRAGALIAPPKLVFSSSESPSPRLRFLIDRTRLGSRLEESEIAEMFSLGRVETGVLLRAADDLRAEAVGETVSYVINRNINYTNICLYKCGFCSFSKGASTGVRGPAYLLDETDIAFRAEEAAARGASEVCLQGGIHPEFNGSTYLRIVECVREAAPDLHIHAFSPLEITHGARTLSRSLEDYIRGLKDAGLSTLPGTAAEILDDDVRAVICPDKVSTSEWLDVMRAAHSVGVRSTSTIMFGHVDGYAHWARHLIRIRNLQQETGGFTEFVPLPFVHMEAPIWRKGLARSGPTYYEALLMHAVARLALSPVIANIQTSWVKMGSEGAAAALRAGANDLGGTLMNESITRAAGGANGQEMSPESMASIAIEAGRPAAERTTLYGRRLSTIPEEREHAALMEVL